MPFGGESWADLLSAALGVVVSGAPAPGGTGGSCFLPTPLLTAPPPDDPFLGFVLEDMLHDKAATIPAVP